jgi:hypothetical protein
LSLAPARFAEVRFPETCRFSVALGPRVSAADGSIESGRPPVTPRPDA